MESLQKANHKLLGMAIIVGSLLALVPSAVGVAAYRSRPDKKDTSHKGYYAIYTVFLILACFFYIVGVVLVMRGQKKI